MGPSGLAISLLNGNLILSLHYTKNHVVVGSWVAPKMPTCDPTLLWARVGSDTICNNHGSITQKC